MSPQGFDPSTREAGSDTTNPRSLEADEAWYGEWVRYFAITDKVLASEKMFALLFDNPDLYLTSHSN